VEGDGAPIVHVAVNFVGVAILLSLATILEWYRAARGQPAIARTSMMVTRGAAV
jgi:hypothetical protein